MVIHIFWNLKAVINLEIGMQKELSLVIMIILKINLNLEKNI
jgi:hypothetical protein